MHPRKTVAIFVDAGFFNRAFTKKVDPSMTMSGKELADKMWRYWMRHVDRKNGEELYRIYFYDCPPLTGQYQHPITNRPIDYKKSDITRYKSDLLAALKKSPYVATRMGELSTNDKEWGFNRNHSKNIKRLLNGTLASSDVDPDDVVLKPRQKGVDMKLGIDITSVVLKNLRTKLYLSRVTVILSLLRSWHEWKEPTSF